MHVRHVALLAGLVAATQSCNAVLDIQVFPAGTAPDANADAAEAGAGSAVDGGTLGAADAQFDGSDATISTQRQVDSSMGAESNETDVAEPEAGEDGAEPSMCALGTERCVGSAVETCTDGMWGPGIPCEGGYCNGSGLCGTCEDGSTRCSGTNVQSCVSGAWSPASPCGGAESCSGAACSVQLVVAEALVTATQTLPVSGPVAFVTDALQSEVPSTLSAQIDWGDGTVKDTGAVSGGSGAFIVSGSHTYGDSTPTTVPITVTVNAPSGASAQVTYSATVRPAATGTLSEFYPTEAWKIAIGADGNVWLTEEDHGIDTLTPDGVSTDYPVAGNSEGIVKDPRGTLWYTAVDMSAPTGMALTIGPISDGGVSGARTVISGFADRGSPNGLTIGPDGNVWFTEDQGMIGRVTSTGVLSEFPASGDPGSISSGPDGDLWFTELMAGHIGRLDPTTGQVIEMIALPTPGAGPDDIAQGPDGNMWFTENGTGLSGIVRLNPSTRVFTEFPVPAGTVSAFGIIVGPDKNLWISLNGPAPVCRITPTGALTAFGVGGTIAASGPIAGPDGKGNIWFVENLTTVARISP
jgi:virginiamycin B lyase